MTGLELAALLVVAAWLVVLSLVAVLCVRQVGILTAAAQMRASSGVNEADDGLAIGSRVPQEIRSLLPDIASLTYLLFLETGCGSCHQLVAELSDGGLEAPIVAVLQGERRRADAMAEVLPSYVPTIRDQEAREVAERMQVEITPTVLELERGFVTGKGTLRGLFDLEALVKAREGDGTRVADELAELSGLNVEVYDGSK
jgi:hypothetical protein